jgi:hypothetical protein
LRSRSTPGQEAADVWNVRLAPLAAMLGVKGSADSGYSPSRQMWLDRSLWPGATSLLQSTTARMLPLSTATASARPASSDPDQIAISATKCGRSAATSAKARVLSAVRAISARLGISPAGSDSRPRVREVRRHEGPPPQRSPPVALPSKTLPSVCEGECLEAGPPLMGRTNSNASSIVHRRLNRLGPVGVIRRIVAPPSPSPA